MQQTRLVPMSAWPPGAFRAGTWKLAARIPTGPAELRRVYAVQPDALAGYFERVAVDHPGAAGDVRQGEGGEEREQKCEADHGGECSSVERVSIQHPKNRHSPPVKTLLAITAPKAKATSDRIPTREPSG